MVTQKPQQLVTAQLILKGFLCGVTAFLNYCPLTDKCTSLSCPRCHAGLLNKTKEARDNCNYSCCHLRWKLANCWEARWVYLASCRVSLYRYLQSTLYCLLDCSVKEIEQTCQMTHCEENTEHQWILYCSTTIHSDGEKTAAYTQALFLIWAGCFTMV